MTKSISSINSQNKIHKFRPFIFLLIHQNTNRHIKSSIILNAPSDFIELLSKFIEKVISGETKAPEELLATLRPYKSKLESVVTGGKSRARKKIAKLDKVYSNIFEHCLDRHDNGQETEENVDHGRGDVGCNEEE